MAKKFKSGDVVLMITGGPKLAVESYRLNEEIPGRFVESEEYVNVVYFASDGFKRDTFHQDLLLFA
jgi:uncharacterized protein YodC (DUF2158 family)